jgi:signal transduction histidine kinase
LSDEEFLAHLSHRLRGHLGSIANWVHILASGSVTPALQKEALEAIEQAIKAQTRIVDELDARLAARE